MLKKQKTKRSDFTTVRITNKTNRKLAILASLWNTTQYEVVERLTNEQFNNCGIKLPDEIEKGGNDDE